jgi:hypothetical protein
MLIYLGRGTTPIVIETNLEFALRYWRQRQRTNPDIRWEFR